MKRCTRKDGTIGLASVCGICHRSAERKTQYRSRETSQRCISRNRRLDSAAKVARGECECDEKCQRSVTAENVDLFEWDHLVQSFVDSGHHAVSVLVGGDYPLQGATGRESRLVYIKCHQAHTTRQTRQRFAWRRAQQV